MRHLFSTLILIAIIIIPGCKTSEENYRAAYEKAIAGRDSAMAFEQTIYGRQRRNINARLATTAAGDTVEVRTIPVKLTADGGGIAEWLKPYSVVVGQFKTSTNAISMRERLVDAGYPRSFVVENSEPYYYILLDSFSTEAEALTCISTLTNGKFPFPLRRPLPFILHKSRR